MWPMNKSNTRESCQVWMHQNILLWPCCIHAAGIRMIRMGAVMKYKKNVLTDWWSQHDYGLYPFYLSVFSVSCKFFQCDHPNWTSVPDLPARNAGIWLSFAIASFWSQWKQWKATFPFLNCRVPNWKMYAIKQIKICVEYWDMLPRPRLVLPGTRGLQPAASVQVPDKPAWAACPGILHRS